MLSLTRTAILDGTGAVMVSIECTTTSGFAALQMVGNNSELGRDGKERAKTVLESLGFKMGHKRILINFSPADSRKEGNHFDLPIAISLSVMLGGQEPVNSPKEWLFAAELGLDGSLRPARSIIPLALTAIEKGLKGVVIAPENEEEVRALRELSSKDGRKFRYLCFSSLGEVLEWLFEDKRPDEAVWESSDREAESLANFDDMILDKHQERLAVCLAAGGHSVLMRGSPGSGKSMFAQRLLSLMPKLSADKHLECLRLHSFASGGIPYSLLCGTPPFRQPHHTTNPHALLGTAEQPGELSLAHGGILFLDELPEFRRDLLEALREPLETGTVHVSRAHQKLSWKAQVQLIAACNNCPCGYTDSKRKLCECSSQKVLNYKARLSGPLLDRIDIHFSMPDSKSLSFDSRDPVMPRLIQQVEQTREFMQARWGSPIRNANVDLESILATCDTGGGGRMQMMHELEKYKISSRSTLRILRVARTLADMEQDSCLAPKHLAMAAEWRPKT